MILELMRLRDEFSAPFFRPCTQFRFVRSDEISILAIMFAATSTSRLYLLHADVFNQCAAKPKRT